MSIMNPYLVETNGARNNQDDLISEQILLGTLLDNVTEDFGLQNTETLSGLWEKQMLARKHKQLVEKKVEEEVTNNWDSIRNPTVKKKLKLLAAWLTVGGQDAHNGHIMWANNLHINLHKTGQKLKTWWGTMSQKSRIALWDHTKNMS